MSKYLGDFALGQTVRDMFGTNGANGGRLDFNNALETADIRVYKDNGATERASQAGFVVTSGFDSMVGVTAWSIDTSDNTTAGFYTAGSDYAVVLYPDETVDSQPVAAVLATFSIENRFPFMGTLPALSVGAIPLLGIKDRGQLASVTSGSAFALRSAAAFADDTLIGDTLMVQGNTQGYFQSASISDNALTGDAVTVAPAMAVAPSGGTYPYVIFTGARANPAEKVPATIAAGDIANGAITEIQSGLATAAAVGALPDAQAIGQELLLALAMGRGNRIEILGTEIVLFGTDGTTEISRQPFTRLPSAANPTATIG